MIFFKLTNCIFKIKDKIIFDDKKKHLVSNADFDTSNEIFSTCNDMTLILKEQQNNQIENENISTIIKKNNLQNEDFNTIKSNGNENPEYNDESLGSSFGTMIIKDDVVSNTIESKSKPSGIKKSESQYEKMFINDYVPKTLLDGIDGQGLSEMARAKILIRNEIKHFDPTLVSSKGTEDKANFLFNLTYADMQLRLKYIDSQMEDEIQALRLKYEQKRQVIMDAVELKRKNSNIF